MYLEIFNMRLHSHKCVYMEINKNTFKYHAQLEKIDLLASRMFAEVRV